MNIVQYIDDIYKNSPTKVKVILAIAIALTISLGGTAYFLGDHLTEIVNGFVQVKISKLELNYKIAHAIDSARSDWWKTYGGINSGLRKERDSLKSVVLFKDILLSKKDDTLKILRGIN